MSFWTTRASVGEFVVSDILTDRRYPPRTAAALARFEDKIRVVNDEIMGCVRKAIRSLRGCNTGQVSGTFHLAVDFYPDPDGAPERGLVQVTDYSGSLGGRRWRVHSARKGVIGRCLRTGTPEWANFATADESSGRMVREFGYWGTEAANVTPEGRSYLAYPVFSRGQVVGVLYLFSAEPQVFPHALDGAALDEIANQISAVLRAAEVI